MSKAKDVSGNMIELAKAKFRLSEINTDIEEKYISCLFIIDYIILVVNENILIFGKKLLKNI